MSNCIICGSSQYKILFKKNEAQTHRIVKCLGCGLMYADPQEKIDSELIAEKKDSLQFIDLDNQYVRKQFNQLADYKRITEFINNTKPQKGSLLEIGTNIGVFLNHLKEHNWNVSGVDPDVRYSLYAKKHFGIDIFPGLLESAHFKKSCFDVVIMLHVIEHFYNPAKELGIINRILKPGGLLVIETPKYDTLMFNLLKKRERSISCDSHLYFFTTETLRKLTEKHGFRIIKKETVGRTLSIDRLLWNIGIISKSNSLKRIIKYISQSLRLDKRVIYLNMRDMQRIYCVK